MELQRRQVFRFPDTDGAIDEIENGDETRCGPANLGTATVLIRIKTDKS